jgi:peptidyl-prolyl cis-trans isomerase D
MLDIMRRKKRLRAVLWLVIISLGLGMLLFFVPGANIATRVDSSAATVDGEPISIDEYAKTYRRFVENFSAGGRNKTDQETLKALGVSRQALDALINTRVVAYAAKRLGLDVAPDEVYRAVATNPNLQDKGVFIGPERYKALLAANNISVTEFEEGIRNMLLASKIRNVVTASLDVSENELRDEYSRAAQEAQVEFVAFKKDDFTKKIKPTEADLKAYFDAHKDRYNIDEQRRAQYLLVSTGTLASTLQVSEQDIQDEWTRQTHEETVDASHILFMVKDPAKDAEVKAKAESVLKRVKAGENFAELAKKFSEDTGSAPQGGELGPFPRGRMVKEFEDVAFALKPGETSDLVRTQFGYHIIKVQAHDLPTLQTSRTSLIRAIQLNKASDLQKRKAAEAQSLLKNQKDLAAIGKALNVPFEIKETPFITKGSDPFANGLSQSLITDIFSLKELNAVGKVADHPLGFAIPKLLETRLPKPPDFNESKARVEKDYAEEKAAEVMNEAAKQLSQEASSAGDLAATAKKGGYTAKLSSTFKRDAIADPEIGPNPQFNKAAFDVAPGSVSPPIPLEGGSKMAVLQVKTRTPFDEQAYRTQRPELRRKVLGRWQDSYFEDYIRRVTDGLEKAGKIRVNPKALDEVASLRY